MFDVVVVGAGPAGAVAATLLARGGARVCLVDRAVFPRAKLCGDTLNPAAVSVLMRCQLSDAVQGGVLPLEGMLVTGADVAVEARYPGALRGLAIERARFDAALVAAAAAAGVEVREGMAASAPLVARHRGGEVVRGVTCRRAGRLVDIPAAVTIAADGRRSTLAFALGLLTHPRAPRRWAIGGHASGVSGLRALGEMHIRRDHYIGIAPLHDGLANVCLVRPFGPSSAGALGNPAATLDAAVRSDPQLRERFARASLIAPPMVLGPLAVDAVGDVPVPAGLIVAGDAAGFIDPMTGDGLRFALRGGELAADAALQALAHGWTGAHRWLVRTRVREFGPKWRFNRMLRGLVGSPLGVRGASFGGRVAPSVVRALVRRASDCAVA